MLSPFYAPLNGCTESTTELGNESSIEPGTESGTESSVESGTG